MALINTGKAIGKVTELLSEQLTAKTLLPVVVGRPEPQSNGASGKRLNLFLFEANFDPSLKNFSLVEGHAPPLWLVLKYLLTAFDDDGESDTIQALEYLGEGARALQELTLLRLDDIALLDPNIPAALEDNPELLKITFDEASSELLARLMQGADEKYRFSLAFQVRPVLIAPAELPAYSLLVGVDYTQDPDAIIGEEGIQIPVLPSLGPRIDSVEPQKFEVGVTLKIKGYDLHLSELFVRLGIAELAVTAQQPNELKCLVNGAIASGELISAGNLPLTVVQNLPTGRQRSSNLLAAQLLPTLTSATFVDPPDPFVYLDLYGQLLGTDEDDVFVALYQDGKVISIYDEFVAVAPLVPQTQLRVQIDDGTVPAGKYQVILKVNGQQAKNSPSVELTT